MFIHDNITLQHFVKLKMKSRICRCKIGTLCLINKYNNIFQEVKLDEVSKISRGSALSRGHKVAPLPTNDSGIHLDKDAHQSEKHMTYNTDAGDGAGGAAGVGRRFAI